MRNIHLEMTVSTEQAGKRIDQVCANTYQDYSRMQFKQWIESGQVTVNGKIVFPKYQVKTADKIQINAQLPQRENWQPQEISLNIAYEDAYLLIINKPAGLVVHPGAGNPDQTLVNALLHFDPQLSALPRAGIIHRLDKDTSGLLCVARDAAVYQRLITLMQKHQIKREYLALVQGKIISGKTIETQLGRHPQKRTQMAVVTEGKTAITHYRIEQRFQTHTLLRVTLETGRTHQIRVHMAHIGHPVVGDATYGKRRTTLSKKLPEALRTALQDCSRQMLHAAKLELIHPISHEKISVEAPLPEDFNKLIKLLHSYESLS